MTINDLSTFYSTASLPATATIEGAHVEDVKKFVETHLRYVKANKPKMSRPYFDRLVELKKLIENANNKGQIR